LTSLLFLVASIILTSWLTISFKIIERFKINNLQAIVFNYITCVVTGSFVNGGFPAKPILAGEVWLPWALAMGAAFITLFNLVAFTAQRIGVSVAVVAYKLSLIIPFLFSLVYYNEPYTAWKIAGVVLALAAVVLTSYPSDKNKDNKNIGLVLWLVPFVLFTGSGMLDAMIKFVEQAFVNEHNQDIYLITAFSSAAVIGILILGFAFITGKQRFDARAILAGIAIGIPNYFSIWCLMHALKGYTGNSSAIIPINNMGIVLISAMVAWLAFKEKLSWVNWMGIVLSLGAIALIAFG
jgi:drug/metabolite transporter (DMT)-like permease